MNLLVLGSGGREHALCWAISASPLCDRLYCAPGNAGIGEIATLVAIDPADADSVIALCRDHAIDLVVVGPEAPLVAGIVDQLEAAGIAAFGPTAAAARLEGSKAFAKDLCRRHGIPTAAARQFVDPEAAKAYVRSCAAPQVVKVDGLAAGKGVIVPDSVAETLDAIDQLTKDFGAAAGTLIIEERLIGEEASFLALVDGRTALPLASAQDHKAVGEGDTGPNTGGMGAYSPAPILTADREQQVMDEIVEPVVAAMAAAGTPYKGVLYVGLMITANGLRVLEFNVRFGDPECQVLMARLMSDIVPALLAARDGELASFTLRWRPQAALCVVMAANGYPGSYEKGSAICGLDTLSDNPNVVVFHAGTRRDADTVRAHGGRVLGVTGMGDSIDDARRQAYDAVDRINWPGGFCRRDIGWRARKQAPALES